VILYHLVVKENEMLDLSEWDHEYFMKKALKEAEKTGKRGDRPISHCAERTNHC
jgi:hypothetical protein